MVKEKYELYRKAFKEVREIIKFLPKNEYRKIPKSFIDFIEENMNYNYEYMVKHIDDFQNQKMLEETRIMLSIVYRDFLASDEEKKQIIKSEKEELLQDEKIRQEKCNVNDIFEKINADKIKTKNEDLTEKVLIVTQEKWYKKILKKIRDIFRL